MTNLDAIRDQISHIKAQKQELESRLPALQMELSELETSLKVMRRMGAVKSRPKRGARPTKQDKVLDLVMRSPNHMTSFELHIMYEIFHEPISINHLRSLLSRLKQRGLISIINGKWVANAHPSN